MLLWEADDENETIDPSTTESDANFLLKHLSGRVLAMAGARYVEVSF